MDVGLQHLGKQPTRFVREEFQILHDKPAYDMVKSFIPDGDMQEIDGWARSFYTLEGHLESIQAYSKPLLLEPNDCVWLDTKRKIMAEFSEFRKVESFPFESGFESVSFESASAAGYGYTGKKGEGNNFIRAKSIANASVRSFDERIRDIGFASAAEELALNSTPDVGLTRTQLAKLPSIKVRNVFGEAFHYILIEGLSAFPLLAAFKRGDTFYFIGKDPTIYVPGIIEEMELIGRWFIVIDWSAFDASVQNWEIDFAFDCLQSMLIFPTLLSKTAFDYSRILFKKRKILAPDGNLWMRSSGIPSGSYFTNMVGSIINYVRITYITSKLDIPITMIRVQGDDSLTCTSSEFKPDSRSFAEQGERFGWRLKPEKCVITEFSDEVTFLGRCSRHRYNVRDRFKALRLICYPEYKVDDPSISTARVHAISEDAGQVDVVLDNIYCAMYNLYGEAQYVPNYLLPFFEKDDFM